MPRSAGAGNRPSDLSLTSFYLFCGGLPLLPVLPLVPLLDGAVLDGAALLEPLLMLPLDGAAGAVELAGGVEAGVLVVAGCLAQAANSIAAASALRATFIFIDDTPVE